LILGGLDALQSIFKDKVEWSKGKEGKKRFERKIEVYLLFYSLSFFKKKKNKREKRKKQKER